MVQATRAERIGALRVESRGTNFFVWNTVHSNIAHQRSSWDLYKVSVASIGLSCYSRGYLAVEVTDMLSHSHC